jgi:uncharacterized protein YegP (UPF0339 family)
VGTRQDTRRQAERAAALKAVGRTWQEIADVLGYRSRQAAQQAVERLQKRNPPESVESARRSATETLRIVQAVLFEQFADAKQRGDNDDLSMLARELRNNVGEVAKLRGLYAPARSEVDVNIHQTATAILDRAESELLALTAQRQHPLSVPTVIDAEVITE